MKRTDTHPYCIAHDAEQPFDSAEAAFFWFMASRLALEDGAKPSRGEAEVPRPCEPMDILQTMDRLYRKRRLLRDHLLVMRHYGRRMLPPDPFRWQEAAAARIWREAMDRLGNALEAKGIVTRPPAAWAR